MLVKHTDEKAASDQGRLRTLARALEKLIHARTARQLDPELEVVSLPLWWHTTSPAGHKSSLGVDWFGPPVRAVKDGDTLNWSVFSGTTTYTGVTKVGDQTIPQVPVATVWDSRPHLQLASEIAALEDEAFWEFFRAVEPYARQEVARAKGKVTTEIADFLEQATFGAASMVPFFTLPDAAAEEIILDLVMLEPGPQTGKTVIEKLAEDFTKDGSVSTRRGVRHIRRTVFNRAVSAFRTQIGDPQDGPEIRALALALETFDPEPILAKYNDRHKGTRGLSPSGVARALNPIQVTRLRGV